MYELNSRVCASRTDENGVMRLSGALDVIQDCSLLWLESEPSFAKFLAANRLGMFLTSRQADILRLPAYGERIRVQTRIYDCNRYFGFRNTALFGEDGRPCILSWCVGAFVSLETGGMASLPKEEMEKVTLDPKLDMDYLGRKIALPGLPGEELPALPVRRSDIDLNGHMNNAKYIEAALECLPEGAAVRRLRVEYRAPARRGDLLYPRYIQSPEGKRFVLLCDEAKRPYAVTEFS